MLSKFAGTKQFLYDSSNNTLHDLSNEKEDCHITSLDKQTCQIFDTEKQADEAILWTKLINPIKCPHCFEK